MKRVIIICLSLLILLGLPACQKDNSQDLSLEVDSLQKEIDLLKSELEKVKKERDRLKLESQESENGDDEIDKVLIEVVNKINKSKDTDRGIFNDRINFHISITNNLEKDIKEIQGVLDIKTMSNVSILRFDCDLTGDPIKPGERFINKDTLLEINQYISSDIRLYKTEHGDLNYTYKINKIIFTDGSVQ